MRESIESLALFGAQLLANPGPMGAAVPSSRALSRRIASLIPSRPDGYVIELGAGTGSVTAALLERGVPPDRLIPVELSVKMAKHLQKRFPKLNVVGGDATALSRLLSRRAPQTQRKISHIVSSLPLRSLPAPVVARIVREMLRLLPSDGTLIQFTYQIVGRAFRPLEAFERHASSIVWMNFPPARVDVFRPKLQKV